MKRRAFITLLGSGCPSGSVGLVNQHEKANHEQGNH